MVRGGPGKRQGVRNQGERKVDQSAQHCPRRAGTGQVNDVGLNPAVDILVSAGALHARHIEVGSAAAEPCREQKNGNQPFHKLFLSPLRLGPFLSLFLMAERGRDGDGKRHRVTDQGQRKVDDAAENPQRIRVPGHGLRVEFDPAVDVGVVMDGTALRRDVHEGPAAAETRRQHEEGHEPFHDTRRRNSRARGKRVDSATRVCRMLHFAVRPRAFRRWGSRPFALK